MGYSPIVNHNLVAAAERSLSATHVRPRTKPYDIGNDEPLARLKDDPDGPRNMVGGLQAQGRGFGWAGPLPLGYDLKDGELVVVEEEAERVRLIFRRYLEVSGINELARDLKAKISAPRQERLVRRARAGAAFLLAGVPSPPPPQSVLIGEICYKGEILLGEQPAIMDRSLFEAVQQKLSARESHKTLARRKSDHLLRDLLFDDAGHRIIPTHATKAGVRYRYYVSQPSLHGEARIARLGSVSRVPAGEIEQAVISTVKEHQINLTLSLAFLAPQLIKAALRRLPRGQYRTPARCRRRLEQAVPGPWSSARLGLGRRTDSSMIFQLLAVAAAVSQLRPSARAQPKAAAIGCSRIRLAISPCGHSLFFHRGAGKQNRHSSPGTKAGFPGSRYLDIHNSW
jgi:hypothetical protein